MKDLTGRRRRGAYSHEGEGGADTFILPETIPAESPEVGRY